MAREAGDPADPFVLPVRGHRGRSKIYPDARNDDQVRDNLAIPELGVAAYAGMPLTDADGRMLGSLCAIDTEPHDWTANELAVLSDLAAACSSELRLRIARELADEARRHAESAHDQLAMLAELTESLAAPVSQRVLGTVTLVNGPARRPSRRKTNAPRSTSAAAPVWPSTTAGCTPAAPRRRGAAAESAHRAAAPRRRRTARSLPTRPGRRGIGRLEDVLRGNADVPGEELCSRLLAAAGRRADDIALLLIRVR